mgnify:CR=1 FL=1
MMQERPIPLTRRRALAAALGLVAASKIWQPAPARAHQVAQKVDPSADENAVGAAELQEKWWPSEWGPEDQLGALNRQTPERVKAAAGLIKQGIIADLGRVFEDSMPLFSLTPHNRKHTLVNHGAPTYPALGDNALFWNEDFFAGHITQNGTQFDALCHMGTQLGEPDDLDNLVYYNGFRHSEIGDAHGFKKLGAEQASPFFARGILVDMRGLLGRPMALSEEFGVAALQDALARQGLGRDAIGEGDVVFTNTGWGEYWKRDNAKFNAGTPGLSAEAGRWLAERKVMLVGSDNWAVEAIPKPDGSLFAPNHQRFLVREGIYIMENLDFSALIEAGVYEFAFSFAPIPLKGATGSPARPFALY